MKKEVNKESFGKKLNKDSIIFGIALLLIGIIIGICLNLGDTFALETSASLDAATASNATSSNATSSNATASNATSSNATASNVAAHDNTLFLNDFSFDRTDAKAGEMVKFNYTTSGACNTSAVLYFTRNDDASEVVFSTTIEDVLNPYFKVPENVTTGKYFLSEILLFGLNSDGTSFSTYYSSINSNADYYVDFINKYINVTNDSTSIIELNDISISKNKVEAGEKINLKLSTSDGLRSVKLIFQSNSGKKFSTYVSDILGNPYFMVPSIVSPDKYNLYQVILTSDDNTSTYTKDDNLKFDISLNIIENEKSLYVYNNSDIDEKIIKNIFNADPGTEIYINATDNSIISEDVFNAIKGSSKNLNIIYEDNYIVFCGKDIANPKSIDAKIAINMLSEDEKINNLLDSGFIINFSSNGNLPGKALVRIKVTDEMKNTFKNDNVSIYYYDEDENGFCSIDTKVKEKNGYYEFNINHNSKYVLVNKKINKNLLVNDDSNVVDFQLGNKMYMFMIAGGVLLILVAILIVLKSKKKNKEKN